jgi:tricorn protease
MQKEFLSKRTSLSILLAMIIVSHFSFAQGTRLLRQPSINAGQIAFVYAADIWVVNKNGGLARRITSTQAVESDPHLSPDGKTIAFTSNRSGIPAVYAVSIDGGIPNRLSWYPAPAFVRGWSPDGKQVLYSSSRETAPTAFQRLWTVPVAGGPSSLLPAPWGYDAAFSPDGRQLVVDRISRWDGEWRNYRGGQNTALQILDIKTLAETDIPNKERSFDIQPMWMGEDIYFLSDRDRISNIWRFNPKTSQLQELTHLKKADIKWIDGADKEIVYEWNGYLHLLDVNSGISKQLNIEVNGDFPWAETKWEDVTKRADNISLSPTGKRILMEARAEIFTVPVENGDPRNISNNSGAADRRPIWSPDGKQIAWFSDADGKSYALYLADQDGMGNPRKIAIGESALAWEPCWSPDGKFIAFADNQLRIKVIELSTGKIITADTGGSNIERGNMGIGWSPDSKYLAYSKTAANNFRRITIWSMETKKAMPLTDPMADAIQPSWDMGGRYIYFLASTSTALGSGWANTSSMQARPSFGGYLCILRKEDASPFPLKTDEEPDSTKNPKKKKDTSTSIVVRLDWEHIDRRIISLPFAAGEYNQTAAGPKGTVFFAADEQLSKFTVETKKLEPFEKGVSQFSVAANGEKILIKSGDTWRVVSTSKAPAASEGLVTVNVQMQLSREQEFKEMFEDAWRYERDYFYDPNMHGRNWQEVYERYAPLVPFIRHRSDLTYVLDLMNGELSVGHSFVFGGDYPAVNKSNIGLLGADLTANEGRWQLKRIYSSESWNPGLVAPLTEPGLNVNAGDYIIAVDGKDITSNQDPFMFFEGKAGKQTVLTINNKPGTEGAWSIRVLPIENEGALRQRSWVEDNRRKVEELSKGQLGYVWVPNTGGPGFVSFNRYYFAQQDKLGAVIDERYNGGGLLDDYMVDLMVRRLRAAATNEVPGGVPFKLPAGILGPKVLLINEMAGSGGDFFPWVFRQQKVGPLIGTRTWGGLVKSSVHYSLADGGSLTAPDNAIFDPVNQRWIAENEGIAPDIEQKIDAVSVAQGRDVQLEKAVTEVLKLLEKEPHIQLKHPPYSTPAKD